MGNASKIKLKVKYVWAHNYVKSLPEGFNLYEEIYLAGFEKAKELAAEQAIAGDYEEDVIAVDIHFNILEIGETLILPKPLK